VLPHKAETASASTASMARPARMQIARRMLTLRSPDERILSPDGPHQDKFRFDMLQTRY
jgi:hypothetical protein